jgi:hypothetical protein
MIGKPPPARRKGGTTGARPPATGAKPHNKLAQPQSRWQRFVRYTWDKKRG